MSDDDARILAHQAALESYKDNIRTMVQVLTQELVMGTPADEAREKFRNGLRAAKQAAAIALEIIGPTP